MKKAIKVLSLLLIAAMMLSFVSCKKEEPQDNTPVVDDVTLNVGVLKGPTGIGAVRLADKSAAKKNPTAENAQTVGYTRGNYNVDFYETANVAALQTNIMNGTVDIAAVPINVASIIYNKSNGAVKVIAANALGVLSIVGYGEYDSIADLKGTTIHTVNKGATPEYILRYVLAQNGIDPDKDVEIKFYTTPTDAVAASVVYNAQGMPSVAMIPEPAVTSTLIQTPDLKVLFDMTEEWDKVCNTRLIQGVLIARKDVIDSHPDAVKLFVEEYSESVGYVNSYPSKAAASIVAHGIVASEKIAELSIAGCNVTCITGTKMQLEVSAMINVLYSCSPSAVGGKLPIPTGENANENDFYLILSSISASTDAAADTNTDSNEG